MEKYKGATPGPWKVGDKPSNWASILKMIVSPNDYLITASDDTETHGYVGIINKASNGEANARLIADAPMLASNLEAAEYGLQLRDTDIKKLENQNERMLKQLKFHCGLCMFMNKGECPDTTNCQTKGLIAEIEEANNAKTD
jgi:hypothetical protein